MYNSRIGQVPSTSPPFVLRIRQRAQVERWTRNHFMAIISLSGNDSFTPQKKTKLVALARACAARFTPLGARRRARSSRHPLGSCLSHLCLIRPFVTALAAGAFISFCTCPLTTSLLSNIATSCVDIMQVLVHCQSTVQLSKDVCERH